MGFGDFFFSQFIDVIEFVDTDNNLLVYKYNRHNDEIKQNASLIVREGQVAVFIHKGRLADIFSPGSYTLDTGNLPFLSSLGALPNLFNSPIKSDLYFINTTQFIGNKWGTKNPILMRDKDFGIVRVTSFGTYSFRVDKPDVFMREVFGARKIDMTYDILMFLNSFVSESISSVIATTDIPLIDLAADYTSMSYIVKEKINEKAKVLGIKIEEVVIENISVPEEVEKLVDEQSGIGLASKNMNSFMQYQTARAMRDASKQEGGLAGLGAGFAFGNKIAETVNSEVKLPKENDIQKLREYKKLLEEEVISQEEFNVLKKQILNL